MGRRTSMLSLEQIKEINMTPLIDLTFLLLITFIITFPLIQQGIPVNLPRGKADDLDESKSRSITVDVQGNIFLDQAPITKEELTSEMQALGRADPETVVMVRADEAIAYGKLVEVVRILHDAKIARMALVTNPEK
ncbi:MAG TPA: biopolymer transporter ExbD [Kiritimatiellia bacterium]|nr:biopolymer transporter ExbD [Kiritimatiellia bacterium]